MPYEPRKYDTMVSWKKRLAREGPFLRRLFERHRVRRVLDFGCGTGAHVHLFASWGLEASGIDRSREMIAEARRKRGGRFLVGRRARGRHDALTCLGNTLPHFFGRELEEVTGSFRESLREGGLLVVQLLNYDRILRTRERFVALGGDRRDAFLRFYDFGDEFLTFNIVHLRWEGKWEHDVSSVRLNPLRKKELGTLLTRNGFGRLAFFGDFEGSPFSRDSRDLICTAKRKP